MSKIKFEDFYGGFVAFNKNWHCEFDNKNIPLALHVEITDMFDATGEKEFENYPFCVSIGIVTANPHKSFNESDNEDISQLSLIQDCVSYMGSVPIDHILLETDSLNRHITDKLMAKDAALFTVKHDYGSYAAQKSRRSPFMDLLNDYDTYAAQKGKGSELTYPRFKGEDAAKEYAKKLIRLYADTHMALVGFILDKPINLMGDEGWSIIKKMVKGVE